MQNWLNTLFAAWGRLSRCRHCV